MMLWCVITGPMLEAREWVPDPPANRGLGREMLWRLLLLPLTLPFLLPWLAAAALSRASTAARTLGARRGELSGNEQTESGRRAAGGVKGRPLYWRLRELLEGWLDRFCCEPLRVVL